MEPSRRLEIFEKVRAEYSGFLTSVLWKLSGDRELFAEAMQIALLKIWQNVEKLNGKKAGAYIYKIAISANLMAWRSRVGKDGQFSQSQHSFEKLPDENVTGTETAEIIRQAISRLPARQARAIVMRYLEQKDYSRIAVEMNCSEVNARSNVSKALAALRKKLNTLSEEGQ